MSVDQLDQERQRRGLGECAAANGFEFVADSRPWGVQADAAFPCATQNEISLADAKTLLANGCALICEGANMPTEADAAELFQTADVLYGPSKAANAGGVAVSGLEMSQNSMRYSLSRDEIDQELKLIMTGIHDRCAEHGATDGNGIDYVKGANVAGFAKVARAMLAYGVI